MKVSLKEMSFFMSFQINMTFFLQNCLGALDPSNSVIVLGLLFLLNF